MYRMEVTPLQLVAKTEQGPRQLVEISVEGSEKGNSLAGLGVHIRGCGEELCFDNLKWRPGEGGSGKATARVHVRAQVGLEHRAQEYTFALVGPSGEELSTKREYLQPVREWEVFVAVHSHCDVGFTHPPSEAAAIHSKNLDLALAAISATRSWPEEAQVKWTVENTWQLQNYRRTRAPERVEQVVEAAKAGRIEITACYLHNHFEILGTNQLHRITWEGEWWKRRGVPLTSAMLSDIPGATWGVIPVLASAGVRYLFMAPNNFGAPFHRCNPPPRPFYWRARGGEELLVWYTGDPRWAYIEGARYGLLEGVEAVAAKLPVHLAELEGSGYPYDAVLLQVAFDNDPLQAAPAQIVRLWNEAYLMPKLRIALPSEFLSELEARYGKAFPVYEGDWPSWWAASVAGYPEEGARSRRAHRKLEQAERLATLADMVNEAYTYPHTSLDEAYDDLLTFDEHSGLKGVWVAFRQHKQAQATAEGLAYLSRPLKAVSAITEAAAAGVEEKIPRPKEPSVIAVSTSYQKGPGLVRVDSAEPIPELDQDPNWQRLAGHFAYEGLCYLGYAQDVPPFSWQDIPVRARAGTAKQPVLGGKALANHYYTIELGDGRPLSQIVDRETGASLLDEGRLPFGSVVLYQPGRPNSDLPGGDFQARDDLYEGVPDQGDIRAVVPQEGCKLSTELAADGPQVTIVRRSCLAAELSLTWEITLYHQVKRVDLALHIQRLPGALKPPEQIYYVALPFASQFARVDHAVSGTWTSPGSSGQIPGSCMDFYGVEDWISLRDSQGSGVVLTSCDASVVEYDCIKYNQFLKGKWAPGTGKVFFRIGHSHGAWSKLTLAFALTSGERVELKDAHRFAQEVYHPFVGFFLTPDQKTQNEWLPEPEGSICSTNEDVAVTHFFKLDQPGAYLVWLQELAGKASETELLFPGHTVAVLHKSTPTGLIVEGEELSPKLTLKPYQTLCLRALLVR